MGWRAKGWCWLGTGTGIMFSQYLPSFCCRKQMHRCGSWCQSTSHEAVARHLLAGREVCLVPVWLQGYSNYLLVTGVRGLLHEQPCSRWVLELPTTWHTKQKGRCWRRPALRTHTAPIWPEMCRAASPTVRPPGHLSEDHGIETDLLLHNLWCISRMLCPLSNSSEARCVQLLL